MNKTFILAVSSVLTLAAAFTSCSKSDDAPAAPEVSAVLTDAATKTLTFTVTPVNAVKCAWELFDADAEIPSAGTILAEGVPAHANEPSTVSRSGLTALTAYKFVVAVENADKETFLFTLDATTADVPAVEFDANRASCRKYPTSMVNFGITLRTEADGVDYELALDIYDYDDTESVYLQPGTYTVSAEQSGKTVGTSYGSYLDINNKMYSLVSGAVVVSINDDKTYTIDVRLVTTNAEESSFHGVFTGNIDGIEVK